MARRSPRVAIPRYFLVALFWCCCFPPSALADDRPDAGAAVLPKESPVKRIVRLLKSMAIRVEEHSKQDESLFERFMCYCKKTRAEVQQSLALAKDKIPQLGSSIEESAAMVSQLQGDVKEHKENQEAAKTAIAEQKSLRQNQGAKVAQEDAEMTANIKGLRSAIATLSAASSSEDGDALLQSGALVPLQTFAQSINPDRLRNQDREALASLLQQLDEGGSGDDSKAALIPESSHISGIMQQMLDDMVADLDTLRKESQAADAQAESLEQAKSREAETLRTTIEDKLTRLGSAKVHLAQLKADKLTTDAALKEDENLMASVSQECKSKMDKHNKQKEEYGDELAAITKAVNVLSTESAAQSFTKTESGDAPASFLQMPDDDGSSSEGNQHDDMAQAAHEMSKVSEGHPKERKFSMLARRASKAARHRSPKGVAKIVKLVTDMLGLLSKEQEDDDLQRQMCEAEMDRETSHKKNVDEATQHRVLEIQTVTTEHEAVVADLSVLKKGIEDLDKAVAEATEQRKAADANLLTQLSEVHAAKSLIAKAKRHLMKYFEKVALFQEQRPAEAAAQQADSSGDEDDYAFLDSDASSGRSRGDAKQSSKDAWANIKHMMEAVESDLTREASEAKATSQADQAEYEKFIKISESKRSQDAKSITYKAGVMAEMAETIRATKLKAKALRGDASQTAKVIADLHEQCDWLLKNFEERKKARSDEHEALSRTLSVLRGANYGLGQVSKHRRN